MIESLAIRNFAIAEQIEIEFDDALTTITGETGAGKSIIVGALAILLGDRADNNLIKHTQAQAEIQGSFNLLPADPAFHWLEQHDLADQGECIMRRVIRHDKPSRGWINGRAVTASQLKQLGKLLVDIHGQNEHHSLLHKKTQRDMLSQLAGCQTELAELSPIYNRLQELHQQQHQLELDTNTLRERSELLDFQLRELEALDPKADEWPALEQQHKKLQHRLELSTTAQQVAASLYEDEDDSVAAQIDRAQQQLQRLSTIDPTFCEIATMLLEANVNIEEAALQLRENHLAEQIDEAEIGQLENRFSLFHELSRKHNIGPENLAAHYQTLQAERHRLINPEAEQQELGRKIKLLMQQYNALAEIISAKRASCAETINCEISAGMQQLGMKGGVFEARLLRRDSEQISRYGSETIEFYVSANPGQLPQPLARVASGGELSRISLIIQVVAAGAVQVPTLIFDEIDVGIGGAVAAAVGRCLQQLGHDRQIICITHLSQVAACGKHHFMVTKAAHEDTGITVKRLDKQQRVHEIARMSTGAKLTEKAIAHAAELLKAG